MNRSTTTILREATVFLSLVVIISSVIVAQVYDQMRSEAFLEAFEQHTREMDLFLDGWNKYSPLIEASEAKIRLQAENGVAQDYSCEAVFMRQHNIIVTRPK
jgi:hypothetical protein